MRQLSVAVLITSLVSFAANAADSSNSEDTAAPSRPALAFGPGPVINPENSQYMEDKKAAINKEQQSTPEQQKPNHHGRFHHGLLPPVKHQ